MKALLTAFFLAAATLPVLPALGQVHTINVCDWTPQVRDAVLETALRSAGHTYDCGHLNPDVVWHVDASGKQLRTLQAGDFAGLTSLRSLNLGGNQLTTVPAGVFDDSDDLPNLHTLHLNDNQLTALPDGVFDGLTSLQTLSLYGNQLTALAEDVFEDLASLQELDLRGNQLTALPDGVFDSLTGLQELDLRGNQLGLTRNDPLFAGLSGEVDIQLNGQAGAAEPPP